MCHVFMDGGGLAMKFGWLEARCDDTPPIIMVICEIYSLLWVVGDSDIIFLDPRMHKNKSPYLLEICNMCLDQNFALILLVVLDSSENVINYPLLLLQVPLYQIPEFE